MSLRTILILIVSLMPLLAQEEEPVFRAGVSQVRLDVQVRDGKRVISDLRQQDFLISDEGQPQAISYFARETDPVSVVLLLDVSGSTKRYVEQMAGAAQEALRVLRSGDRVAVIAYSREAVVIEELTSDLARIPDLIASATRTDPGAGTSTNAAIIDAAKLAATAKQGRRAILVLTDNHGLNYQVPDQAVLEAVSKADATVNAIVVGKAERPRWMGTNPDFTPTDVFGIAEKTGGETVRADSAAAVFGGLLERIRTRYSIYYNAPESQAGAFRKVQVSLTPEARKRYPKAEVLARSGYYAQ